MENKAIKKIATQITGPNPDDPKEIVEKFINDSWAMGQNPMIAIRKQGFEIRTYILKDWDLADKDVGRENWLRLCPPSVGGLEKIYAFSEKK